MNILLLLFSVSCLTEALTQDTVPCNEFKLRNGRMRLKPKGKLARFQCNTGYILAGEKYSYCVRGKFDVKPPVCVKPTCSKMKPLANGVTLASHNGAVVYFYCKPGYILRGPDKTFCDGKQWINPLPSCLSTQQAVVTSCDFSAEDLCGWAPDLNHDFDWRRQQRGTPSGHVGTGPRADHSGDPAGWYLYTEATSRLTGDIARLLSPVWRAHPSSCFTLWYHMRGKDIGALRVYMMPPGGKTNLLWEINGEQGDKWYQAKIELGLKEEQDLQIVIEGVRGKSYISDIAIDDVALLDSCPFDYDESTTETWTVEGDLPGSCLNRCEEVTPDAIAQTCMCFDGCYENNTCCPDYTAICLIEGPIDEYFTDTTELTPTLETEAIDSEITETEISYASTTEQTITFSATNNSSLKPIIITTEQLTTKSMPSTSTARVINSTTTINIENTTNPSSLVTSTVTTTESSTVFAISTILYNTTAISTSTANNDEIYEYTGKSKRIDATTIGTEYEYELPDIRVSTDAAKRTATWAWTGVAAALAAIVTAATATLIVLCRRRRRHRQSTGSMSDVRFLASDELLDFTWRGSH